jgi:hypothetical protein
LKLNLQIHSVEETTVVHCHGRIAYRDETLALRKPAFRELAFRGLAFRGLTV